jgi:hypothetical protein
MLTLEQLFTPAIHKSYTLSLLFFERRLVESFSTGRDRIMLPGPSRAPSRRPVRGLQQPGGAVWRVAVWTVAVDARPLLEPRETFMHGASQPHVAGFTADTKARAPRGQAPEPGRGERDNLEAFGHGGVCS